MHLSYYYRHGYRGPTAVGDFAERALGEKPTIAAERVVDYMRDHLTEPVVISGFRAPAEISFLKSAMEGHGKRFELYFVAADEVTRYARLRTRERPGDDLTLEQFRARDDQQKRMGLDMIQCSSDMQQLNNVDSFGNFLAKVDNIGGADDEIEIDVNNSLEEVSFNTDVGLEDEILVALLSVWSDNEARRLYTTTEISVIIVAAFPKIRPMARSRSMPRAAPSHRSGVSSA